LDTFRRVFLEALAGLKNGIKATDQGKADTQAQLGHLYNNGSGVQQDYRRTME
jgi:TPR repeat protein